MRQASMSRPTAQWRFSNASPARPRCGGTSSPRQESRSSNRQAAGIRMARKLGPTLLMTVVAMIAIAVTAKAAFAQVTDYPARASTIIVPFVPGGITDLLARVVADNLG